MKNFAILLACLVFLACGNKGPDVSGIDVNVPIHRFEKFLFEQMDTTDIARGVSEMHERFPFFAHDFLTNILGLPPVQAGAASENTPVTYSELKRFIRLTRPLYDSLAAPFAKTGDLEVELREAFRHVKYYFPAYEVPRVVTYLGPLDAPAVAITPTALAIGLQLYAGRDFSFYTSVQGQEMYPMYISRRFEPQYIPADCMKAVADDLLAQGPQGRSLIELAVSRGKTWYLLNRFLPETPDSIKTGFSKAQLKWCEENEGLIWNFMLKQSDLYTTEPELIKTFLGEAPSTEGMPKTSPGNIGQWIGWRLVESYAANHPDLTPASLIRLEPLKIFQEAKYKPR